MQKLKVKDEVIILTGKDRGKTGPLLDINFKTDKVLVKGINLVKKTMKPTQENPSGGIVEKENYIHISNVAVISPTTNKASRVRIETQKDKKVRVAVSCGTVLDK